MRQLIAAAMLACAATSATPALAQVRAALGDEDKTAMLRAYSVALGRRFACDNKGDAMVSDIKRYTYMLQIDREGTAVASSAAKTGIISGMAEVKDKRYDCAGAQADLTKLDNQMRAQQGQVEAAAKTVSMVGGAALECGTRAADVTAMEETVAGYVGTDGLSTQERHSAWQEAGRAEVRAKAITCERAKRVFYDVAAMFAPPAPEAGDAKPAETKP